MTVVDGENDVLIEDGKELSDILAIDESADSEECTTVAPDSSPKNTIICRKVGKIHYLRRRSSTDSKTTQYTQ